VKKASNSAAYVKVRKWRQPDRPPRARGDSGIVPGCLKIITLSSDCFAVLSRNDIGGSFTLRIASLTKAMRVTRKWHSHRVKEPSM
jgi:hypothetical protein